MGRCLKHSRLRITETNWTWVESGSAKEWSGGNTHTVFRLARHDLQAPVDVRFAPLRSLCWQ